MGEGGGCLLEGATRLLCLAQVPHRGCYTRHRLLHHVAAATANRRTHRRLCAVSCNGNTPIPLHTLLPIQDTQSKKRECPTRQDWHDVLQMFLVRLGTDLGTLMAMPFFFFFHCSTDKVMSETWQTLQMGMASQEYSFLKNRSQLEKSAG